MGRRVNFAARRNYGATALLSTRVCRPPTDHKHHVQPERRLDDTAGRNEPPARSGVGSRDANLNPRNLRFSGRATALFASLTFSRSFLVRNWLTEAICTAEEPMVCLTLRRREMDSNF